MVSPVSNRHSHHLVTRKAQEATQTKPSSRRRDSERTKRHQTNTTHALGAGAARHGATPFIEEMRSRKDPIHWGDVVLQKRTPPRRKCIAYLPRVPKATSFQHGAPAGRPYAPTRKRGGEALSALALARHPGMAICPTVKNVVSPVSNRDSHHLVAGAP